LKGFSCIEANVLTDETEAAVVRRLDLEALLNLEVASLGMRISSKY